MKRALVIGLAAAALSSGCDPGASESPLDDGLLTRSTEGRQDQMTAIVGGTLELDPGEDASFSQESPSSGRLEPPCRAILPSSIFPTVARPIG